MVGIAGIIALGILALIGCGIIMMLAIAVPVALVNFFRGKMYEVGREKPHDIGANKGDSLGIGATLIILGVVILVGYVGIKLFEIFIPAVVELMNVSFLLGLVTAGIMSVVFTGPMISLFTYKLDRRIDDLSNRISEADKRLDFEVSHRLFDELKTAEIQYEKRKNTVINVLVCTFMAGFFIWYLIA